MSETIAVRVVRKLFDSKMLAAFLFILWGCAAAWASWMTTKVEDIEQMQSNQAQQDATIETEIRWIKNTCVRIENKLDRMNP